MNIDIFSDIGNTHRICQDYSLAENQCLILSDGCSSAPNTDFGSRLLVKAAQFCLSQNYPDTQSLLYSIISTANVYSKSLQLSEDCLSATLMFGEIKDNLCKVVVVGDGMLAVRSKDDSLIVYNFRYPSGAPYYLRYELNSNLKSAYFKEFGDLFTVEIIYYSPSMQITSKEEINNSSFKNPFYFEQTFDLNQCKTLSLFTDGVYSFNQKQIPVSEEIVLKEFLSYKSYAGEFVRRRCNKVLKIYKDNGINHFDDFSMGTIYNGN